MKKILALFLAVGCLLITILLVVSVETVRFLLWIPQYVGKGSEYLDDLLGSLLQWTYCKTVKPALKKAKEWAEQ